MTLIRIRPPRPDRREVLDVGGMYPDVAAYCAGAPDCMVNLGDLTAASRPIIRLLLSRGALAVIKPRQIETTGSRSCPGSIGSSVKASRWSWLAAGGRLADGRDYRLSWIAKRAGEAMELDRLAFVMAHPSMLPARWLRVASKDAPS